MKILYASLFPENPIQHEYENLDFFIKSSKFYNIYDNFNFYIFSAHSKPIEFIYNIYKDSLNYFTLDFKYNEKMNERRGHEISFCKSYIFQCIIDIVDEYDFLFFTDSDIRIDSKEIFDFCKLLEKKENTFINIPYALRDLKQVSLASFGCYIIPSAIIKSNKDLWKVIYNIEEKEGLLCRIGAPDCNIRNSLISKGYNELRALSACTRHYTDNIHYVEYDEGKIKIFN